MNEGEPGRPAPMTGWRPFKVETRSAARVPCSITWPCGQTDQVTMGEALEAASDEPVQGRHGATVAVAEACATGLNAVVPGGLADSARLSADANAVVSRDDLKTTVGDVLGDAVARIPAEDAVRMASAEIRIGGDVDKRSGGVADSVAAAVRLNESP